MRPNPLLVVSIALSAFGYVFGNYLFGFDSTYIAGLAIVCAGFALGLALAVVSLGRSRGKCLCSIGLIIVDSVAISLALERARGLS